MCSMKTVRIGWGFRTIVTLIMSSGRCGTGRTLGLAHFLSVTPYLAAAANPSSGVTDSDEALSGKDPPGQADGHTGTVELRQWIPGLQTEVVGKRKARGTDTIQGGRRGATVPASNWESAFHTSPVCHDLRRVQSESAVRVRNGR